MKKLFILFLFTIINIQAVFALSGIDAGSVNSSAVRDLRLHEALNRNREKNSIIKNNKEQQQEQVSEATQAVLSEIKSISFVNNVSINSNELLSLVQSYINKPMTGENIAAIRKLIMKYYQQKGYYSVIAMISAEDTQSGNLVFDIKEGGKNSIIIQNEY